MFDLGSLSASGLEAEAPPSLSEQEIAGSGLCCWRYHHHCLIRKLLVLGCVAGSTLAERPGSLQGFLILLLQALVVEFIVNSVT